MSTCRIFYFRAGGILEQAEDLASDDLLEAARRASSKFPELTAEIWLSGRKAAVVRPSLNHRLK